MSIYGKIRSAMILSLCLGAFASGSMFAAIEGAHAASSGAIIRTSPAAKSQRILLGQQDNGRTITVQPNDNVTIVLDENMSTGYSWAVTNSNEQVLTLQGTSSTPAGVPRPGAGDIRLYTFVAQAQGTDELAFRYWRSWEGDSSITQRFDVTIRVAPLFVHPIYPMPVDPLIHITPVVETDPNVLGVR
ncbi:MAG TPA: protease inhibitor I42 family protein [Ktedonosporobacter sp.]|nr:protease inhibitor I42 family protein [Ktedonosporobacter sp.]